MVEIILRGRPWEFAHAVVQVGEACGVPGLTVSDPRGTPERVAFALMLPGPPELFVIRVRKPYRSSYQKQPVPRKRPSWHKATFTAISLPDDRTLVTIQAQDEDWQQLAPGWDAIVVELSRLGFMPKEEDEGAPTQAEPRPDLEYVPNPDMLARVREFHNLRKAGRSVRDAIRRSGTDSRTYYSWCIDATGEKPIVVE